MKMQYIFSIVAIFAAALFVPIVANHEEYAVSSNSVSPGCLATSSCGVYYGPCVQEYALFSYAWCVKIFPY